MSETEDYDKSATPTAHKTTHQDGGSDEISVLGLSGLLADGQTPLAHKTSHQDTGTDEISVEGLAGELTAEQKSAWSKVSGKPTTFPPEAHADHHQDTGTDEISVAGLSGTLADDQHIIDSEAVSAMGAKAPTNPLNHDRYADSEALAAAVQSGAITDGVTKAPTHDAVYDVKVMTEAHKTRHQDTGADEISVAGLSGLLVDDQHVLDSEVTSVIQGYFKKARASLDTVQTIANDTYTKVAIDVDIFDPSNITDLANHRILPNTAGYYIVIGHILFAAESTAISICSLWFNGGEKTRGQQQQDGLFAAVVTDLIYFDGVDDYVELYIYQNSGGPINLQEGPANNFLEVLGPF